MSEIDSFLDGGVPAAPHSDIDSFLGGETKPQGKGVLGHVRDTGVSAAKSVVGVPEALVGLADIPTGGAVGKALENEDGSFGVRFKETQDILSDLYTDEYKEQQRQFSETDGVLDKASVALQNPSLITNTVVQSVGPMLAGGAIGKGAGLVAKSSPVVAGAIGEGAIMAGSQAEGIRQQTEDGLLTAGQSAAAAATGGMGGLFGYAGGRLAQKLGIGDVDTMLAGGVKPQQVADDLAQTPAKSVPRQVIEGAISEGFLEELPQSVSEQIVQNLALGKDWSEGVEDSAVMGTLAGMAMGGVGAGFAGVTQPKQEQVQPQPTPENPAPAPVQRPNPNAGPLSAAANLLPAPESDGTLYGDAAGNVSGNRPSWVNPENDPGRQSFGPGMDSKATGPLPGFADKTPAPLEGEHINLSEAGLDRSKAGSAPRQGETFDGEVSSGPLGLPAPQRLLADGRPDAGFIETNAAGESRQAKTGNVPPKDYVPQGGRGMDQQAPIGKRFGNELAARNAVAKAAQPDTLEVVSVGPKEFEVRAKAPVLQNRDRSTPASITQMREIAARPDYSRLGFSRDFANGAPVVEPGANVSAQQLGRQDVATTGSGRKIPVQYAVVEAASLMPSHDANGTPDQHYATGMKSKSRAIAGNGRVAGLRQAFAQGTAAEYVEQLAGDSSLHGISPATIRSMKEPVLVRIMPREEITQDIGDESNTTGVSALSGAEQAMNDARRINIDDMEFSASGEISETTVRQFVQSMPKAEQGGLLDGSRPSRQAYDRAESAIFANAYESESLIRLQAQATDPEVRTVLSGLLMAAPKMARLKGAGAWDIRGLVVEAAEAAVNARRNGQTLEQFAQQIDLDRNPESQYFIELFAANIRSAKRIGDELSAVAELFYAEASKAETDMFGAVPRRSRQELLNGADNADTDRTPADPQAAGNQAGPGAAAPGSQARDAEPAERAGAAAAAQPESFQLDSYSEEELAAQAAAQAEAAAKAAAADKAAADKVQADRDRNDFTLTGSDRPSDVAASRGQNDMFAPPTRGEKKAQQEAAKPSSQKPDRQQSIADAQAAAAKVLSQGGSEADANRAATDLLIERMADDPSIAIATDAPAAVQVAKLNPLQQAQKAKKAGIEAVTNSLSNGQFGATLTTPGKFPGKFPGTTRVQQLMAKPDGGYYWGDWYTKKHRDLGILAGGKDKDGTPAYFATKPEAIAAALAANTGANQPAVETQDGGRTAAANSTAPEHLTVGVDDRELAEIVDEFNAAQQSMQQDGERIHHLFDAPEKKEIVRLADKAKVYHAQHGWMTVDEAKAKIQEWKKHAAAQDDSRENADKVVLSLFDKSGAWSRPWEEAGYQVYRFDIQDDPEVGDVNNFSTDFFGDWFGDFEGNDIYAILAACPCTDFAVSGARHFAAKDADGRTVASVNLVHQTLRTIEYFRPAVWAVENPVGRIEKLGGLPPWRLAFDPNHLGDPYTKKTLIWGRFNGDLPVAPVEPTEGSKMHKLYGGKSIATKNARSVTPEGFAYGFFMANNAIDHPAMAISNKYDRLDRGLIEQAVSLGMKDGDIADLVDDFYFMDLDDEGANDALREAIAEREGDQAQADAGPDGWRSNLIKTRQYANQLGVTHKGKSLEQLVAEIDGRQAQEARQPIRFTSGQPASDYLAGGSIIEDGQGQQYRVHYQRNDLVLAHPIIDGNAQVNAESGVRFHVGRPESADGRRTDPIYLVQDKRQQAQGVADQLASMNLDDLSALIDEISEQEAAPQTAKPKAQRSSKAKTASGKPRVRSTTSKAERTDTAKPDDVSRSAGEIAKSLGVNMSSAGMNALEGLTKLFGGPGRLNSGLSFDEETYAKAKPFFAAAMRDIEAAGKDLRDFIRALLSQFGDGVKPYILRYAQDIKQEQDSVYSGERVGADSSEDAGQAAGGNAGGADAGAVGSAAGSLGQGESGQQRPDAAAGVSGRGAAAQGERSDKPVDGTEPAVEGSDAGAADSGRGRPSSTGGLFAGRDTDAAADRAIASAVTPAKANVLPSSKPGTAAEIKAQMPFLTDGQAEDVAFAERRLSLPEGYGVLYTNGTGTGKTFTGLGTAARAHANGKRNILIVAPKQTIVDAWVKAGEKFFGLPIKVLESTQDNGGSGIVATTYANLGANAALAQREWDMVIADEAHYLSSAEDGSSTAALETLRALTKRRGYARNLVRLRESEKVERLQSLTKEIDQADKELAESGGNANFSLKQLERDRNERDALNAELNALYEKEEAAFKALKPEDAPRGVFLSATPFAYEKNVHWAQQFLFDWGSNDDTSQAYNAGGPFERFMIQHFGYRMRYNKLTEPDAKVDRGLMQRAFNTWLKREGALSGRALDSAYDYDRKFVTLEAPIGRRVDDALKWLRNHASGRDMQGNELNMSAAVQTAYRDLQEKITGENFNYHARMYFLEAIKAREALPHIRAQLAKGRKVVVMHDFKQGGVTNPFIIGRTPDNQALNDAIAAFSAEFADLQQAFSRLPSPIQQLTRAFPDALVYNGDYSAKQRLAMQNAFNDDSDDAPRLIIAQGDAMREGVSIHDTTGKFPRVLVHLGMPVKPTAAIQQEGRIYRTGQASHAMFRYFTIGTAWERSAFAGKIAKRAGAAENLAMGEQARGLKQAFIDAYEDADLYEPGFAGEGQGGKARDQALAALLTPWDMAKSFYFGTKTQGKGRSSRGREGADYFATPEPVGLKMVEWADIRAGESVLEPSAGHGAIARWFPDGAKVRVIEQSGELASRVALHVDGDVVHGSFEDHHIVNKYDAIVMNPPYGLGGAVAIPHLAKAAEHLRDGGRVVALIPTGPAADKKFDNWLYALDKNGKSQHPDLHLIADVAMPSVTFERAGTSAATRLVIIERVTGEQAEQLRPTRKADLTSIESIGELFDRLENMEMPARLKPVEEEAEQTAPAKSVKPAKLSYAEQAAAQVDKLVTDAPIIEHTTGKGKVLKGVIVTDMSLDEVREKLDKYAFRKNGGVFVRQEYIARPDGGAALFSRRPVNVAGAARPVIEHDAVKAIVERVNARLGLPLPLRIYRSESELFAAVPEIAQQADKEGAKGQINAVYHDGSIHVVTSAFARKADVELAILDALAHEGQGHYGIRSLFGGDKKEIDQALRNFFAAIGGLDGVPKVADKHGIDMSLYFATAAEKNPIAAAAYLADELLAHLQGKAATASLSERTLAAMRAYLGAVREWLRNHGFTNLAKGTDADIAWLLKRMRDASKIAPSGQKGSPRFVRSARQTDTEAFRRWFGKSQVVGSDGAPLTLHHGTAADFTVFDQARAGSATGHATSALGIFMSSDRRAAQSYAEKASDGMPGYGRVMDLYASIQNPYLMSVEESQEVENPLQARRLRTRLEQQGYDGIRLKGTPVWIAFNNYQVKSATDNTGAFDEFDPDIRFSRSSDAATREALRKMGLGGEADAGLIEKIRNLTWGDLKAKIGSMATRAEEGLFDGLIGIKRAEEAVGVNDPNQQGYVSARLATGLADVMHAVLHYGAPEWRDGIIQRRDGTKGVLEILAGLGQDNLQAWLGWLGGKRGQMLKAEGRENNLSDTDIAELLAMGRGKEELFERVYREYAAVNEAVLDLAEGAGLIDPTAREKWATEYYVPFYRQSEAEGIFTGPRTKRGLSHQTAAIKKLKGGELPTNDLLVNILSGWTKRIDASMKNKALLETVDNLKGTDYLADEGMRWTRLVVPRAEVAKKIKGDRVWLEFWAEQLGMDETANHLQVAHELNKLDEKGYEELWGRVAPTDPDIIRVQRGGKNEFYRVKDDSLLRGLKFIEGSTFNDPITRIGRTFKRMLTTGVTASPDFILRNFIRDAAHAWTINKDGFTFGVDSIKGMRKAFAEDEAYRDLMFGGASFQGGYIHGTDPEASADIIRRALAKKGLNRSQQDSYLGSLVDTPAKAGAMLRTAWEKYRELGDKVENANRLSTYTAAREAGKSKRQAAFEAKDLMDFSMRGNFAAAQWFTDVVPFLNARAQGLYKLGRAMKGDKTLIAKEVAMKGGYLALFSLLLAAANGDDERYKQLADWDKDANWHLWFSDDQVQPFRIPKPFELGLLFGTLPERLLHAATGTQDSGDLGKAIVHGVFQTLAFNPVPQFYQPIREVQANRNFFFDMPIEDMSDEGKLPEARYDERTSALGRSLGQITGPTIGVSPKQLDHLVRGYTGTLGGYVLSASNLIAGIGSDAARPAATAGDIPLVKVLYAGDGVKSTQYQTDFYDMLQEVEQLHRTVRSYAREGRVDEARELFAENRDKLRHRPALGFARQQLGNVRKQMDAVYRNTTMSAAEKREKLNTLQTRANTIARRVSELAGKDF